MAKIKYGQPVKLHIRVKLNTGLHIGAGKEALKIGGIDSPVVKNPLTDQPYIPGSSLKGKIRALLEMVKYAEDLEEDDKGKIGPIQKPDHIISKIFGMAGNEKIASKILFGDLNLTQEWENEFNQLGKVDFYEDKSENMVPRFLRGNANPRNIERVPAGVEFEGEIVLIPVEGDDNVKISIQELETVLKRGLELLEAFGLGGNVSRGYGRVEVVLVDENGDQVYPSK